MKKLKIIFLIGIIIAIVIIPVSIFAINEVRTNVDEILAINTVFMGSDSVEVFKEKSREERTQEKIEMSEQYQSDDNTTLIEASELASETISDADIVKSQEAIDMEEKLADIAEKYNRHEDFKNITAIIDKQEINGDFTSAHKSLCELFLDIYEKEPLTEEEATIMKDFFIMVKFNNIDLELEERIDNIID